MILALYRSQGDASVNFVDALEAIARERDRSDAVPAVIHIDDPDDPRLADYREVRERDLVGREGGFIAEGEVVLEKLVRAGRHPLRSVLVAEKRVAALAAAAGRAGRGRRRSMPPARR